MSVFYPACTARLSIRFDDAYLTRAYNKKVSQDDLLKRLPDLIQPLSYLQKSMESPNDGLSRTIDLVPQSASIELPGYRQAGKFKLTFAFADLPLDVRAARTIAAEIHMGAIPATSYAKGMTTRDNKGFRESLLSTRKNGVLNDETLILLGTADNYRVNHSSKGSTISMEGRDTRGVLLDAVARPKFFRNLDLTRPINEVVAQILSGVPYGALITVAVQPGDWPNGVPSPAAANNITRVRQKLIPEGDPGQIPMGDQTQLKVWDIITNYCFIVGAVPYFSGRTLLIRRARSLYDQQKQNGAGPSDQTPFAGGKQRPVEIAGGAGVQVENLNFRRVVFGEGVEDLNFERKFTGLKTPVIEVVSLDTSSPLRGDKKLIKVMYPQQSDALKILADPLRLAKESKALDDLQKRATHTYAPVGEIENNAAIEDVFRIVVPGINSTDQLLDIARDIYEEMGRGEMGGSVKTSSLCSFGGDNQDADLLRLRPGDAVQVLVNARNALTTPYVSNVFVDQVRKAPEQAVQALALKLGDTQLARLIVVSLQNGGGVFENTFRVGNVRYDWSSQTGLAIAFDFQNYVEARYGVTPSTGPNKTGPKGQSVPNKAPESQQTPRQIGLSPALKGGA